MWLVWMTCQFTPPPKAKSINQGGTVMVGGVGWFFFFFFFWVFLSHSNLAAHVRVKVGGKRKL